MIIKQKYVHIKYYKKTNFENQYYQYQSYEGK